MPTPRIVVPLELPEARALAQMSEIDCRHPRDMMRWLLIQEVRKRGLLPAEDEPSVTSGKVLEDAR